MSDAKRRPAAPETTRSTTGEFATPAQMAAPVTPVPGATSEGGIEPAVAVTADDPWTGLAETQAAFARGIEEAAAEVTGMARTGFTATADAAIALLGARTLAEIVEINAALSRRGVDAMFAGVARLSEIGLKAVAETSHPLVSRFGANWHSAG